MEEALPYLPEGSADRARALPKSDYLVAIDTEYFYNPVFTRPWDRVTGLRQIGVGDPNGVIIAEWGTMSGGERSDFALWLLDFLVSGRVVFQNTNADIVVLEKYLYGKGFFTEQDAKQWPDSMFAHAALWAELPHSLEFLASVYGKHEKLKHLAHTDPLLYLQGDVLETANTWLALEQELRDDKQSERVYREFMLPLRAIIRESEDRGIRIDPSFVGPARDLLTEKADTALSIARSYAGYKLNLNSSEQVKALLRVEGIRMTTLKADKLVVERGKFLPVEKGEDLNVGKLWERLDDGAHPILEARAAFIQADKQLGAYITPLYRGDGSLVERVYPHFLPTAQDNGRWSTTEPPLAQVPASLRKLLIPDAGFPWLGWDWSAIELRLLACMAQDKELLDGFANDWDLHTLTCCGLFGLPKPSNLVNPHTSPEDEGWRDTHNWEGKDDKRRVFSKTFVYRIIYGGDPKGAGSLPGANKLGVPAAELVRGSYRWLEQHPKLQEFWGRIKEDVMQRGMVRSFLGRRRMLQETDVKTKIRQAFDMPCQAGTSDIFNNTLIKAKAAYPVLRFVYGCHDSQYLAMPIDRLREIVPHVLAIAEQEYDIYGYPMKFTVTPDLYFAPEDKPRAEEFSDILEDWS